jgi:hypothetical protein
MDDYAQYASRCRAELDTRGVVEKTNRTSVEMQQMKVGTLGLLLFRTLRSGRLHSSDFVSLRVAGRGQHRHQQLQYRALAIGTNARRYVCMYAPMHTARRTPREGRGCMHSKYKDYRKDTQLHDTPRHGHRHCLVHRHKVALALALALLASRPILLPPKLPFTPLAQGMLDTTSHLEIAARELKGK